MKKKINEKYSLSIVCAFVCQAKMPNKRKNCFDEKKSIFFIFSLEARRKTKQ